MKLCYSIRRWASRDWQQFCWAAADAGLQGLEIDSVRNPIFTVRNSPTNPELAVASRRQLSELGLSVPCIGVETDLTSCYAEQEASAAIETAHNLLVPYVVLYTASGDAESIVRHLENFVALAEKAGVVLLLESSGPLADTKKLVEVLDHFA